ncbi:YheC/YheD family protein [Halalkalibacter flavus]|uniref:YheC/YheD family protein n=1 Tax=Halalkalibacter flavus TaxID=3090668 RepID=UPI002FC7602B
MATHLRLHVQKDGEGNWNLTAISPCIAKQGFVANISIGGYTKIFEDYLKQEFDEEYHNIKR